MDAWVELGWCLGYAGSSGFIDIVALAAIFIEA